MSKSKAEYNRSTHFYKEVMDSFQMDFSLYEDLIEVLKPKSILELGCGMGRLFPLFMKEADIITGVDLSDGMVKKGRSLYSDKENDNTHIEFICGDMCFVNTNKKYDLIVLALSVLKHLQTNEQRFNVLRNAKEHLNKNGFIVIDHAPFLYNTESTNWINANNSMVKNWVSDHRILDGYQWKKDVLGDSDVLKWRYVANDNVEFETSFTTYRYDIEKLLEHISKVGLKYEQLLTEWGVNGLSSNGNRFIGLISYPYVKGDSKRILEKVKQRNETLWSNYSHYLKYNGGSEMKRCDTCLMPLSIFKKIDDKCEYCSQVPPAKIEDRYTEKDIIEIANRSTGKYDCLVPISGGRDSAFVLYYAKKILKLNPLAVHFNNGFITKEALSNVHNMTTNLGVDFISHSISSSFLRKLMKLFFMENGEFCTPCNRGKKYVAKKFATENNINMVFLGFSYAMDKNHITDDFNDNFDRGEAIFNEVVKGKLTKEEIEHYKEYLTLTDNTDPEIHMVHLPDMIDFDYHKINNVLTEELGWSHPDGQFFHGDCYLNPFVDHLIHNRFGYSEKQVFISNLIKYEYIDKEIGNKLIESERITETPDLAIQYIQNAFNMDKEDINEIISKKWKKQ